MIMARPLIVTIDGPGGTGKSTVSRAVAERLGFPYLDTGAFYRAATLAALRSGVALDDAGAVVEVLEAVRLSQENGHMLLDGEDVSTEIRETEVTAGVSAVSAHAGVRRMLVALQREWVVRSGSRAVVEGRDIGSIVFPDAHVKIYLDARPEVRAMRRAVQEGSNPSEAQADLERRDHLDSTRKASPLTVPEGSHVIDTSDLDLEAVVSAVMEVVRPAL